MKALLLISLSAMSLGACAVWDPDHQPPRRPGQQTQRPRGTIEPAGQVAKVQAAEAKRAAAQRCGPTEVKQRAGTDGTQGDDYKCKRPKK